MKLIKFYTTWCEPCKVLTPILNKVCDELSIELVNINAETDYWSIGKFNIAGVPTLILLDDDNKELKRHVGIITEKHLVEWMRIGE